MTQQRIVLTLIGTLSGLALYLLALGIGRGLIEGRLAYGLALAALGFCGGLLAMTGPLLLARAALSALVVSCATAVLFSWAGLRFAEVGDSVGSVIVIAAVLILLTIPWPFVIAEDKAGWRDYPTLFAEGWGMVMRVSIAALFVGLVWGVIFLSDAVLGLVGVTVIGSLLQIGGVAWLVTGAATGLALAVVLEFADLVTANLVLRLLGLLVPVPVLVVVIMVFVAMLPLRGMAGLFGATSITAALLAIAVCGVTLVTASVDQDEMAAPAQPWMQRATQVLAALVAVPAGLAVWAVWLRVVAGGRTPNRLLLATAVLAALGYGALYLVAVLRGGGWMEQVRQANISMAGLLPVLAVLWLTPILNPEAIAARNQMARFNDGRTQLGALDLVALQQWGGPGRGRWPICGNRRQQAAAGNAALSARLAAFDGKAQPAPVDLAALRASLARDMPLQPASPAAAALRDAIFAQVAASDLGDWLQDCDIPLPQGGPGCVLGVADLLTDVPGDEAMLIGRSGDGYMTMEGFAVVDGVLQRHGITSFTGALPEFEAGAGLIHALQLAAPAVAGAPVNQISAGGSAGLAIAP